MTDNFRKIKKIFSWLFNHGVFFGFRVPAFVECILLLVPFLAFDIFLGNDNRFIDIYPHPFWLIILIILVQYTINEALVTAVICSAALLLHNLPEHQAEQDIFQYYSYILHRPLMWVSVAVLFGLFRSRELNRLREMKETVAKVCEREKLIAASYESMKEIKEILEVKLVGQLKGAATAYQAVQKIEKLSQSEVLMNINSVISEVMAPKKFSVFSLGPYGLECLSSHGWQADETFSRRISPENPVFQELIAGQRILTIVNAEDEKVLGNEGVLAAPLIDPVAQSVFGIIKIEAMDLEELTYATMETFQVLCEWIGRAYANAELYEAAKKNGLMDLESNLYSYELFKWQYQILERLGKAHPINVSCISIGLSASKQQRLASLREINTVVRKHFPHALGVFSGKKDLREVLVPFIVNDEESGKKDKNALSACLLKENISQKVRLQISQEMWRFGQAKAEA